MVKLQNLYRISVYRAPLEELPQIEGFQPKGSKNSGVLYTKGPESKEIATRREQKMNIFSVRRRKELDGRAAVHGLLLKYIRGREDAESASLILFLILTY